MAYAIGLVAALTAFWFALSRETSPLFLGFAVVAVALASGLAARLRLVDRDAAPYHRAHHVALYAPWLAFEVIKANIEVIRQILAPRHRLDPGLVEAQTHARTDLGRAVFANSITLTPGTVTVEVIGAAVRVHALDRARASADSLSEMDRRASRAGDGRVRARKER